MILLQNPAWFGNYRITSRIATGGMAEVYVGRRAREEGKLGPVVAVKRLLPHLANDTMIVRMFLNEARITAQILHPNVVKIIEVGEVDGEPFIAMELLDGRSFADLRQKAAQQGRRVPLGITLRVLTEACRGLDAAHRAVDEQGRPLCIVHRDFTPDNIHVGVRGDVKVIDFGIAKAENLGSGTEPGTLKGKFFYMSPEMIAGRPVDHRADLFAAGVMLYEQLCGRRPFTGMGPEQVLDRIAEGRPKRPSEFDPSIPRALESVCLTALAREPERRFESLHEFIFAIESVGGMAELATPEELGVYVSQLFPADQDPKQQNLRLAIQADPSIPAVVPAHSPAYGVPMASALPPTADSPAPHRPAAPSGTRTPAPQKSAVPTQPPVPPLPAGAVPTEAPAPTPAPRKGGSWKVPALAGGLLALVAVGLGARTALSPGLAPQERLTAARAVPDGAARAKLLEALATDPRTTPEQLQAAFELLLDAAEPEPALALAQALEARQPRAPEGFLLEARATTELRLGKRAEVAIQRAAGFSSAEDARAELLLADLRERQGDLSGALEALDRARKKQPNQPGLWLRQGNLLSQAGRLDEAAEVLSALLKRDFEPEAAAELAFVRFRQEQVEPALSLLKRALKKEPRLFKGHYYLGAVLFRQGDVKGAERAYREADGLLPGDPRALAALCELQARGGDEAGAQATRAELASRFPKQAAALTGQCKP